MTPFQWFFQAPAPIEIRAAFLLFAGGTGGCRGHNHHGYSLHRHDDANREIVHRRECTLYNFLAEEVFPKFMLQSLSKSLGCTETSMWYKAGEGKLRPSSESAESRAAAKTWV